MTVHDPAVIAVDIGSGSARALVYDVRGGLLGLAQREWSYQPVPGVPGGFDFEAADGWAKIVTCIREAIHRSGVDASSIVAISASSMREGCVLWDAAGHELWGCPNIDARASVEAGELIADGLAERHYRRGGDWTSITAPARLRWLRRHRPDVLQRTHRITMLGDWAIARLSGTFCTDPSLGSSSNMFDLAARSWSAATCGELDLAEILPEVVEPGTVVGTVLPGVAAETGLSPETRVVAGGADTQMALLAAGITSRPAFATVSGTFWQTAAVTTTPVLDPAFRLRTLCHVVPGAWMIEGVGFLHGAATRWVRDTWAGEEGYSRLEALAARVPPGANGLTWVSSQPMNARNWRHGAPTLLGIDLLDPERSGPGAIFRAVQEEATFVARAHYAILEEVCGSRPETIRFVGGPARSRQWPQILADVTGFAVEVPPVLEATTLGAAMSACVGVQEYESLDEAARAMVGPAAAYHPIAAHRAAYDEAYARWNRLKDRLLQLADDGETPYLWKGAAG